MFFFFYFFSIQYEISHLQKKIKLKINTNHFLELVSKHEFMEGEFNIFNMEKRKKSNKPKINFLFTIHSKNINDQIKNLDLTQALVIFGLYVSFPPLKHKERIENN